MNVTIRNVKIEGFAVGIELASFNKGAIHGNIITNNGDSIRLSGFGQFSSFGNAMSENTITGNENGIVMEGYVVGNLISGNTITNNSNCGIILVTLMPLHSPAEKNIVSGNTIANNGYGICLNGSSKNLIYHNDFANNTVQVSTENSANVWDDGYPSGGNYWSDHVCTGIPSDGSEPCILDESNMDRYPFQIPDG
jgi:parallel beta-helix repeat protein